MWRGLRAAATQAQAVRHILLNRRTLAYSISCLVAIVGAACSGGEAMQSTPPSARGGGPGAQAVPVTAATVEQKAMPLDLGIIGSVEPTATVSVRAQMTGELIAVNFREGDDVQKGQALFRLDRRPLEGSGATHQPYLPYLPRPSTFQ